MHLILKIDWQQYIRRDRIMHIGLNLIGSDQMMHDGLTYFLGTGIDLSLKYSYLLCTFCMKYLYEMEFHIH